jgi:hypothetical protein
MPFGADAFSMPLFQQNDEGGLVYIGSRLVPHFDNYSNWREVKIISRYDGLVPPAVNNTTLPRPHPWDPSVMVKNYDKQREKNGKKDETEFLGPQGETANRTSLVVRFKGNVDVMLTPLLLEGLQR